MNLCLKNFYFNKILIFFLYKIIFSQNLLFLYIFLYVYCLSIYLLFIYYYYGYYCYGLLLEANGGVQDLMFIQGLAAFGLQHTQLIHFVATFFNLSFQLHHKREYDCWFQPSPLSTMVWHVACIFSQLTLTICFYNSYLAIQAYTFFFCQARSSLFAALSSQHYFFNSLLEPFKIP